MRAEYNASDDFAIAACGDTNHYGTTPDLFMKTMDKVCDLPLHHRLHVWISITKLKQVEISRRIEHKPFLTNLF